MRLRTSEDVITKKDYEEYLKDYTYIADGCDYCVRYKQDWERAIATVMNKYHISKEEAESKFTKLIYSAGMAKRLYQVECSAPLGVFLDTKNPWRCVYIYR